MFGFFRWHCDQMRIQVLSAYANPPCRDLLFRDKNLV